MKKTLLLSFLVGMLVLGSCSQPAPRVSIFADHIATVARQEKISFAEAATRVRALGYEGVDVSTTIGADQLHTLDSLGFQHACAIANIDFTRGPQDAAEEQTLTFMKEQGWKQLLLVPGLIPDGATQKDVDAAIARVAAFAEKAAEEGLSVMVEDFDNPRSLCYNMEALDKLFAASPALGHVFDTGNYIFCGDDIRFALEHFFPRVHHVHLKDRRIDGSCPAVGDGTVPMAYVITHLLDEGYTGWFTVEHFGSSTMYDDASRSITAILTMMEQK